MQFIPLRTPGGESTSHIGLFVRIKMDNLSHKKASSSRMCLLQDNKPFTRRFTSPMPLETSKHSLYEIVEEMDAVVEHEHSNKEKTADTGNSTDLPCTQPIMAQQGADMKCIVEIHTTPNTDDS